MDETTQPDIRILPPIAPINVVSPSTIGRHETAYRTAHDLLSRRAPKEALEVLEPALAEEPDNRGLRSLRSWAFLMRAQLKKAEAELVDLVADDPSDAWSRHALGRALERQAKYDDALPHLRLAAAMTGDSEHEYDVLRVERMAGKVS